MTTIDPPSTVVRVSSPGDLLTLLPYHLGYVPERSLVVVALRGTSLSFVGRVDLPVAGVPGREAAAAVLAPLARHRIDRAVVVTVEDALTALPAAGAPAPRRASPRSWTDLAREVCAGLRRHGAEVEERITVRDGRWWHPDGRAAERRPRRLPDPADVPAVAEYVGRGRVPLRHRDDLAGLVLAGPGAAASAAAVDDLVRRLAQHGAERRSLRRAAATAWVRLVEDAAAPDRSCGSSDVDLLVASLHDVPLRDLVLFWLCPDEGTGGPGAAQDDPELTALARTLDASGVEQVVEPGHLVAALTRVCRSCPPGRGAPLLGVLGHVAWWHGDGTLARVAVDAALAQDPRHALALLLSKVLDLAVPPRHVA